MKLIPHKQERRGAQLDPAGSGRAARALREDLEIHQRDPGADAQQVDQGLPRADSDPRLQRRPRPAAQDHAGGTAEGTAPQAPVRLLRTCGSGFSRDPTSGLKPLPRVIQMSGPLSGVKILEMTCGRPRPLGLPDAGGHGRGGDQGRAAAGRQQPHARRLPQPGHGGALPHLQPQQAQHRARRQAARRTRRGAEDRGELRRRHPQQPPAGDGQARARLPGLQGGQPEDHLLRHLRLRHARAPTAAAARSTTPSRP